MEAGNDELTALPVAASIHSLSAPAVDRERLVLASGHFAAVRQGWENAWWWLYSELGIPLKFEAENGLLGNQVEFRVVSHKSEERF